MIEIARPVHGGYPDSMPVPADTPQPVMAKLGREYTRQRIAELIEDGGGWRACSGCQEGEDGYVSTRDYPYDPVFRCQPGSGCSECGGIGVLWEPPGFWDGYGEDTPQPPLAPDQQPMTDAGEREAVAAGNQVLNGTGVGTYDEAEQAIRLLLAALTRPTNASRIEAETRDAKTEMRA